MSSTSSAVNIFMFLPDIMPIVATADFDVSVVSFY